MTARRKKSKRHLRSLPFVPNRGLEIEYARELRGMVIPMVVDVRKRLVKLYRRYQPEIALDDMGDDLQAVLDDFYARYPGEFETEGRQAAIRMVNKQKENADKTFASRMKNLFPLGALLAVSSLGAASGEAMIGAMPPLQPGGEAFANGLLQAISQSAMTPEMRNVLQSAVIENVSLIRTIPAKFLDRVAGAMTRAMQAGADVKALSKVITKYGEITLNHATRIALDQTFKTFTAINLRKFQAAGIRKFEWVHTGGSLRPRPHHLAKAPLGLNGGVFDIDDPPVIDPKTGEVGYPGQLPYCRCVMCAVVEYDE